MYTFVNLYLVNIWIFSGRCVTSAVLSFGYFELYVTLCGNRVYRLIWQAFALVDQIQNPSSSIELFLSIQFFYIYANKYVKLQNSVLIFLNFIY